jgi:hypothetical protein
VFVYIDESGSFVTPAPSGSWNVVGALAASEQGKRALFDILKATKLSMRKKTLDEIKLKDFDEEQFATFVRKLQSTECILFLTVLDSGGFDLAEIEEHQSNQVARIAENRSKMKFEEGRLLIDDLANRVRKLSPQLYVQLVAHLDILSQVLRGTTLYFSQRRAATLSRFRWRIDEKNPQRPSFEEVLTYFAPPLLQSKSLKDPIAMVEGFDYSHFQRFEYEPGTFPQYLQEAVGRKIEGGLNLGKLLNEDKAFVSSHSEPGVQIVDLLVSGFRRVLRAGFADNIKMAELIGGLTVQHERGNWSVHPVTLGRQQFANSHVKTVIGRADRNCRKMMHRP